MELLLTLLAVVVILTLIPIFIYNGLVHSRNKVDEGWSGIDVQLKRRHDLIPNLVNTVKGYADHENKTLQSVVEARSMATSAHNVQEAAEAENILTQSLGNLFMLSESYPDLKANQNFIELQKQIAETEDELSASRRIYNGNVRIYNTKIQSVPHLLIAKPMHFEKREFFEIENLSERENVAVSF